MERFENQAKLTSSRSDLIALDNLEPLSPTLTATSCLPHDCSLDNFAFALDDDLWRNSRFSHHSTISPQSKRCSISKAAMLSRLSVGTFGPPPSSPKHAQDTTYKLDAAPDSVFKQPTSSPWVSWDHQSLLPSSTIETLTTAASHNIGDDSLNEDSTQHNHLCLESSGLNGKISLESKLTFTDKVLIRYSTSLCPASTFLPWLQDMFVTLDIDQEGFRCANIVFKPSNTFNGHASIGQDRLLHFIPSKRQFYLFHHAPLDGRPLLRRITANGDVSRDFVTRLANISLKLNTVYAIRGSETCTSDIVGISSQKDIHWQFEYLVNDRRSSAGKVMAGEKTLLPLSFSCSPNFLHPAQSKKITVMHVMKKGLAQKLEAEKVEPPSVCKHAPDPTQLPQEKRSPLTFIVQQDLDPRRTQTHDAMKESNPHSCRKENVKPPRPRRASSAGERCSNLLENGIIVQATPRHILRQSEIAALMDNPLILHPRSGIHGCLSPRPRR